MRIEYLHPTAMDSILSVTPDQSVYQHEAWSVAFVWIEDLSRRLLGRHLSLIFIIPFAALIFLYLTFALVVMYYEGRWQTSNCICTVNECLMLKDNAVSMLDTFNN